MIATRLPKSYKRAVELLVDLRDLAERAGRLPEAVARIRELCERHGKKVTLMKRLSLRDLK